VRGERALGLADARDPEIEHLHEVRVRAPADQHDVFRLEVAVHDAPRVRLAHRVADLQDGVEGLQNG
jgi:hypothetical protein